MTCYVKHINYGVYGLAVTGTGGIWAKWVASEGQRKITRPDRLSLCRCGRRGISSARSVIVSFAGGSTLNRRFGASETKAGQRNVDCCGPVFDSDIMVSPDSEGRPALDVSYQFFYWLRKTSAAWKASGSRQSRARSRLNRRDIGAVDRPIDRHVFAKVR